MREAAVIQEMILEPGDLAALLAERGIALPPGLPSLAPDLMETGPSSREPVGPEGLDSALAILASSSHELVGRRSARRCEPWPFFLYRSEEGPAVLVAPEGCGHGRLRFPYSEQALMDWLVGPFRRFAAPEIGWTEIPALAPSGLAVLLAIVDLFRHRYPELDPDWADTEPVVFDLPELLACLTAAIEGADPSSLVSALAGLGLPRPHALTPDQVEALLYVFANEGYLELDLTHPEPLFALTEAFVGVPLSLAWWDLTLGLEAVRGEPSGHLRVVQGLALWSFRTLEDGRVRMQAVSGQELEARIQALVFGHPPPAEASPPKTGERACPNCGHIVSSHAKFCGGCGGKIPHDHCPGCGHHLLEPNARFCPECGGKL